MLKLVVREGVDAGKQYSFPDGKDRIVLGRQGSCEVPVLDSKASRSHAEIYREGSRFLIRDLKSRNGTLVNDKRIQLDEEIKPGDRIRIGDTVVEFVGESADQPAETRSETRSETKIDAQAAISIPGYEILERIGEGPMDVVYRARQVSMDRLVSLRVLNEKYSKDEEFVRRFQREAQAAAKLSHQNVVHVLDAGRSGDVHYVSLEYIDGETVDKLLQRGGRIAVDKALKIVIQVAKALRYAHENGMVHRDVKPENIVVAADGTAKLAGVGLAKAFDESGSGKQKLFGTPHYMAPEQALGKAVDARTDIYSLGATFYHMLTGRTPFQGSTVVEVLRAHVESALSPIQEAAPEVPDSVAFIVERMMAKAPEKRYPSAEKLLAELEKVAADSSALVEPLEPGESSINRATTAQPARKHVSRRKTIVARRSDAFTPIAIAIGAAAFLMLAIYIAMSLGRSRGAVMKGPAQPQPSLRDVQPYEPTWPPSPAAKKAGAGPEPAAAAGRSEAPRATEEKPAAQRPAAAPAGDLGAVEPVEPAAGEPPAKKPSRAGPPAKETPGAEMELP